jgi:hypothetical protein
MATVRHNMGTVQEHIVLSCVAAWLCEHSSPDEGSVQYIDTHTMAPYGEPVGRDFNCLLDLATRLKDRGVHPAKPRGAVAYFQTVLNRYVAHSANRQPRWYPTHFLHAWHAISAENASFSAHLFENDDQGAGRRELLEQFLASHDLGRAFNAVLAPAPGSFRESKCWPEPAQRAGRSMLIMSDPLEMEPSRYSGGSYMHVHDIEQLSDLVRKRYLSAPQLLSHVIFCLANPGSKDRYSTLTNRLSQSWRAAFGTIGVTRCCGVKWGSFLVFVGVRMPDGVGTVSAFRDLKARIRTSLRIAHSAATLSLYDESGSAEDPLGVEP